MLTKWKTPLGTDVRLVPIHANVSPHSLVETLLDYAESQQFDVGEFTNWQAERLERLVAKIRESQGTRER